MLVGVKRFKNFMEDTLVGKKLSLFYIYISYYFESLKLIATNGESHKSAHILRELKLLRENSSLFVKEREYQLGWYDRKSKKSSASCRVAIQPEMSWRLLM